MLFANRRYQQATNVPLDMVGRPIFEIFSDSSTEHEIGTVKASLQQVLSTREPHQKDRLRYDLPASDSNRTSAVRYWQGYNIPVLDEGGQIQYIIQRVRDVTEAVANEARLAELEAQERERQDQAEQRLNLLQTLLTQAPVAMALFQGDELVVTSANQLICSIWSRSNEQVVGRPLLEAMPELEGQGFDDLLQKVLVTGVPYHGQETPAQLLRDGKPQTGYFNFTYQAVRNEQEEIIGVVNVAAEVTEQVATRQVMEEGQRKGQVLNKALTTSNDALRSTNKKLEASQGGMAELNEELEKRVTLHIRRGEQQAQTFDAILAALQDFVFALDTQGRFTYANRRLLDLLRISLNEIIDKTFHELPYPADQANQLMHEVAQVVTTGKPLTNEIPFTSPAGDLGYYEYIFQPVLNDQQRVVAVAGSTRDITLRKQSEENLRVKNQELTTINTDLDNFIYNASHDLKAPISNIEALLDALLRTLPSDSREDDRTQRITDMMQKSVERFKRTIANLTEVVKLQKDNSEAAVEIDLAKVVQEVRLDMQPLIRSSGVQLTVDLEECPTVHFSRKNLRSVVYNLLSNAIKYRSPERASVVSLRSECISEYDLLTITDNGLGMDPGRRDQLFGMFKRFHDHVEGSGIGLYMVKKIVENAGGKIEVSSTLDEGATFQVYFKQEQ